MLIWPGFCRTQSGLLGRRDSRPWRCSIDPWRRSWACRPNVPWRQTRVTQEVGIEASLTSRVSPFQSRVKADRTAASAGSDRDVVKINVRA